MTRREKIFDILKKEKKSAQELANYFKIELGWIIDDLERLAQSIRPVYVLKVESAFCKQCGFVFKERSTVKAPSKCPKCKSTWIQASLFSIGKKEKK